MPSKNTRKFMPKTKLRLVSSNLRDFFYWMYERQNIWYNRFVLKKKRPWTDDEILNDYKFTNVYRELDRNTDWLIKNVINKKLDSKNTMWKIIVFRYFNKPELFDFMGGIPDFNKYDKKKFDKSVIKYRDEHGRVFTDAYMINPPKQPQDKKLGIELFYCKHIGILHNKMDKIIWKGYEEIEDPAKFNKLLINELHCIAGFLAYEIYCDLCYTKWFKWNENDFVNVGFGAKFGLELLFPSVRESKDYSNMLSYLKDNSNMYFNLFGFKMKYYNKHNPSDYKSKFAKRMTLRTIEHSLCEFSKFWKMKLNVGKPRQKFQPKTF